MGSSQRLAAVAAVSHARHYYNHTQPDVAQEASPYTINVFFISATLCGVLVAVCAACWRRSAPSDKPDDATECRGVYTVSADVTLTQVQENLPGPPPAYDTVVADGPSNKQCHSLQEVVTESCPRCENPRRESVRDGGLPSYEAAVLLKDTKL
ncbi:uncharacterized protein LOC128677394 [Plodia interpunctella]|uniref:uncharacterized protein LOC128677394 n=1 Tax=Plodia interpunctella TaxID=58824 RepID=UPI002368496A|nr:uncharacterized protein LOC128677394 [Plodia interpunctella]